MCYKEQCNSQNFKEDSYYIKSNYLSKYYDQENLILNLCDLYNQKVEIETQDQKN